MDELDNLLGRPVAGRGFSGEQHRARHRDFLSVFHNAQIVADDAQHVQQLALIFVDALDLDIEHRGRVDDHPRLFLDDLAEPHLVVVLHVGEALLEFGGVRILLQLSKLFQVGDPLIADGFTQQT